MKTEIKTCTGRPFLRPALILIVFALACFALSPMAQAVLPPPDGGYANFNTAEGENALRNLTTGIGNAAVGWFSLSSNTDGSFNTAVGAGTLLFNVGDQSTGEGDQNTAIGTAALLNNTTGSENTAVGVNALLHNTEGDFNTATGEGALQSNTNTANGEQALFSNTTGQRNTANGSGALGSNTEGIFNTATGFRALLNNTIGSSNIALGFEAGFNLSTGDNNIDIGNAGVNAESGTIRIGTASVHTRTFIAGINSAVVSGGAVFVNGSGQLGIEISSARFKDQIKPMDKASEAILALRPVTFRYKNEIDPDRAPQFGLVAEEVERVNPDLIVRDKDGKPYSVRYDAVNAMLLNEFLKEHRKVEKQTREIEEQKATISDLKKALKTVVAHLKEQDSKIQKVNDQIQLRNLAPQLADNNE
jgi:hypothetical protein